VVVDEVNRIKSIIDTHKITDDIILLGTIRHSWFLLKLWFSMTRFGKRRPELSISHMGIIIRHISTVWLVIKLRQSKSNLSCTVILFLTISLLYWTISRISLAVLISSWLTIWWLLVSPPWLCRRTIERFA
jgi:hypothetical protein